ncbi:hypothetical protein FGO68_gene96 [Halteria grandinella]|uniref:Uncharacterized protein n=1 Tax=Halteria grandinella TaxID=5974 RepID=A0A8J8T3T4_HALGN|nr:hypothetical protein FGO68_gene96 [Halteria grandinella]
MFYLPSQQASSVFALIKVLVLQHEFDLKVPHQGGSLIFIIDASPILPWMLRLKYHLFACIVGNAEPESLSLGQCAFYLRLVALIWTVEIVYGQLVVLGANLCTLICRMQFKCDLSSIPICLYFINYFNASRVKYHAKVPVNLVLVEPLHHGWVRSHILSFHSKVEIIDVDVQWKRRLRLGQVLLGAHCRNCCFRSLDHVRELKAKIDQDGKETDQRDEPAE